MTDVVVGSARDTAASLRYFLGRLGLVELRAAALLEVRGRPGPSSWFLEGEQLEHLVAHAVEPQLLPLGDDFRTRARALEAQASTAEGGGARIRLRQLSSAAGLTSLDEELLVVIAAPRCDARFALLVPKLDRAGAPELTVATALELVGIDPVSAEARARLGPGAPLRALGLVEVEGGEALPGRRVVAPARVVDHLLGGGQTDPLVARLLVPVLPVATETTDALERLLRDGQEAIHVHDLDGVGGESAAIAALDRLGYGAMLVDLARLDRSADVSDVASACRREALLRGAGIVMVGLQELAERGPGAVRVFADGGGPCVLVGRAPWDPQWSTRSTPSVPAVRPSPDAQRRIWQDALGGDAVDPQVALDATASYRLSPRHILRAAEAARQSAIAVGRSVEAGDFQRGVRAQSAAGLQRLARRIEPRVSWDDLVLPTRVEAQLRELPMRWRHRDRVLDEWGMGRGVASGRGVSALFAGPSGTGKTLSAEVIAGDLGLDLYLVDLSTVVDKYIGETSKNLERIFDQAQHVNGVLLFDEADALFGKRSGVSDSKDRHANVEVAFLLQRIEAFDGLAILTTNLAANLDDAFLRRLDAIVDFTAPGEEQRRAMWKSKLGSGVPCEGDVDVDELATRFTLSGAEIANVIVSAAYRAADEGRRVSMRDLVVAVVREHRKLGRHLTAADLGHWASVAEDRA